MKILHLALVKPNSLQIMDGAVCLSGEAAETLQQMLKEAREACVTPFFMDKMAAIARLALSQAKAIGAKAVLLGDYHYINACLEYLLCNETIPCEDRLLPVYNCSYYKVEKAAVGEPVDGKNAKSSVKYVYRGYVPALWLPAAQIFAEEWNARKPVVISHETVDLP